METNQTTFQNECEKTNHCFVFLLFDKIESIIVCFPNIILRKDAFN